MKQMSPLYIQALINIYYSGDTYSIQIPDSRPLDQAIDQMQEDELIEDGGLVPDWTCTARGRLFVEMILRTPLPELAWDDPRNEIVRAKGYYRGSNPSPEDS